MSAQYYEGIGRRKTATARFGCFGGAARLINERWSCLLPREGDLEIVLSRWPPSAGGLRHHRPRLRRGYHRTA
jgi:hypothetical protein